MQVARGDGVSRAAFVHAFGQAERRRARPRVAPALHQCLQRAAARAFGQLEQARVGGRVARRALQFELQQFFLQVLCRFEQADLAFVGAQVAFAVAHQHVAARQRGGGFVETAARAFAAPETEPRRPQHVAVVERLRELDRARVLRHSVVAAALPHPQMGQPGARGGLAAAIARLRVELERAVVGRLRLVVLAPVAVDAGQQRKCAPLLGRRCFAFEARHRFEQRLLGFVEPALPSQCLAAVGQHEGFQARQPLELGPLQCHAVGIERWSVLELAQVAVAHADQEPHREPFVALGGGEIALSGLAVEVARHRQFARRQALGHRAQARAQLVELESRVARQREQAGLEREHRVLRAIALQLQLAQAFQQRAGERGPVQRGGHVQRLAMRLGRRSQVARCRCLLGRCFESDDRAEALFWRARYAWRPHAQRRHQTAEQREEGDQALHA